MWVCNVWFLATKQCKPQNPCLCAVGLANKSRFCHMTLSSVILAFPWHFCSQKPKSLLSLVAQPFIWSSPTSLPVLICFHLIGDWWTCSGDVWLFQLPVWFTALHCISEQKARKCNDCRLLLLFWGNSPPHRYAGTTVISAMHKGSLSCCCTNMFSLDTESRDFSRQ